MKTLSIHEKGRDIDAFGRHIEKPAALSAALSDAKKRAVDDVIFCVSKVSANQTEKEPGP